MAFLSIIIPVGPKETNLAFLLSDLERLTEVTDFNKICEVILVSTKSLDKRKSKILNLRYLVSQVGRGHQLNHGAKYSHGKFLWFLHADSRLNALAFEKLIISLNSDPTDLHYFDLKFLPPMSGVMHINEWGAKIRSDLLGMPFGDQGLSVRKDLFETLGRFQNLSGEDHHFIWQAKLRGIKLKNIGAKIFTSARKYEQNGWWSTTSSHLILTFKQAIPYWRKILKV